jgi:chaperonin GroEL
VKVEDMGRAKRIVVDKENTTLIEGRGKKADIQGRIGQLKKEIEDTTSDYDKEKLQERLAKLAGGVAVVNVGAATETEMKEKKARVEDALHATRAAVEEGIVPGGGVAYIRCQKSLDALIESVEGDEKAGVRIVQRALEQPARCLCQNAGVEGSVIVEQIKKEKKFSGYDVDKEVFVDMFEAGIIDPTKVSRTALQNAASVASLMLTTEALITEIPEKKKSQGAQGGGGGGYGGGEDF